MQRVRVTIRHNPNDSADDLRLAARLRRDLWGRSLLDIDPDKPRTNTHRDQQRNAYFEFVTDRLPEVERVVNESGYAQRTKVEVIQQGGGSECVNCGNIAPDLITVCPTCAFRDIDPCPYCGQEVARLAYVSLGGDVFRCPVCHRRVRFRFNDPVFDASGRYNPPLVRVTPTEAPVGHDV